MVDMPDESHKTPWNIYSVDASDPDAKLVDREHYSTAEIHQIDELMAALAQLRAVEQQLSDASQRYMRLGQTDMKALHFLIVSKNTGTIATAGALAAHLEISTASTTKLLDRLETHGHIVRSPHPKDRRALAISITDKTHATAVETIGRQQAKRFNAAARLTSQQRDVVTNFLKDMAEEITLGDGQWDGFEEQ